MKTLFQKNITAAIKTTMPYNEWGDENPTKDALDSYFRAAQSRDAELEHQARERLRTLNNDYNGK